MYGASACLVGIKSRHDGTAAPVTPVRKLFTEGKVIPVCPEQLGGLATPRLKAEIVGGTGEDVLDGKCAVLLEDGTDVTLQFLRGAEEVLRIAKDLRIKRFYLKSRSPSCSAAGIYSRGTVTRGNGVAAAALLRAGVEIVCV